MRRQSSYAIAYDISSDRERTRVEKVLLGFGFRVQKSVFECRMSKGVRERLVVELEALDLKTGFVYIYQLQPRIGRLEVGRAPSAVDDGAAYIV